MLKETFKMRKIGKHLVNVSMLSLAIAPVVVSGVQPVFAEERVANKISDDISFEGHNVVDKLDNTQAGSNSPDSDGSYNSQIESISVISKDTNNVRYRIKLKDNFVIPKDGYIHFYMEGANQFSNANDLYIGKTKVGELSVTDVKGTAKALVDALKAEQTLSEFKNKLDSASTKDVIGASEWKLKFNDDFAKLNKDRSIEFTIGSYKGAYVEKNLPTLYLKDPDVASLFADGTSRKKYETRLIIPSITDKALVAPYNLMQYPLDNTTTKMIDDVKYDAMAIYNMTKNPASSKKLPMYLSDVNYTSELTVKSVGGNPGLERTIERNRVTKETLFLKKGDKLTFAVPSGSKRLLDLSSSLKVGDVVEGARVDVYSRKGEDGSRFTDSSVYEKDKPLTTTSTPVPLKITKISESGVEYEIQKDVPLVDNTFSVFNFDKATDPISVSLRSDWLSVYGADRLKTFLNGKESGESLSVKDGFGFNVKLSRDDNNLFSFNDVVTINRNTNLTFGDLTKGTIKVRYVDTTGTVIKGTDTETVAENKPWYESVSVTPKLIKGYTYVSASAPLSTIVGSGEQVITLTYKQDLVYVPDPKYAAGEQVPDPDDPSKIHVGTKPKVVEEEIPFKEEVRENPKLPKGTENVIQEGEKGKKTTTTTYTLDEKTGKVTSSEKVTTKDPKNRIIERGTGEDKDGDLIVNYIPDPENEPGKQTIVDEGKKPKLDVTGKVKDPGKPKVIKVGTKPKVVEEDIPFKEEVRENPKLPKGSEFVIQEGEKGKKKTTTTYTLDPKTGKVTSEDKVETKDPKNRIIERGTGEDVDGEIVVTYIPDPENDPGKQTVVDEGSKPKLDVTGKVKDPGKPKVIKVGTKPKVVEEDIPFKEEVRENPKLPKGTENVIQEGEKGKKTTTTTYTMDPKTGEVKPTEKVTTKDPKTRIIERGTGENKDGDLIVKYIPDPEEEPGKQTVVDEGKKPKFDVTGKELDPGSPKVIKVGTKPKVVEEEVPFKEEVRENPELPEGERKIVQEGQVGKKTTTTTYTLDEKTGKVKESTTEKVDEPKVQIVEVGTKKPEVPKEEPKAETPTTTETPKKEEPKVEQPKTTEAPKTEQPKTTEEPKAKETPKELPKTSEQAKQRNTAIIALLSVVGLGGLATYLGLRKRDEK